MYAPWPIIGPSDNSLLITTNQMSSDMPFSPPFTKREREGGGGWGVPFLYLLLPSVKRERERDDDDDDDDDDAFFMHSPLSFYYCYHCHEEQWGKSLRSSHFVESYTPLLCHSQWQTTVIIMSCAPPSSTNQWKVGSYLCCILSYTVWCVAKTSVFGWRTTNQSRVTACLFLNT